MYSIIQTHPRRVVLAFKSQEDLVHQIWDIQRLTACSRRGMEYIPGIYAPSFEIPEIICFGKEELNIYAHQNRQPHQELADFIAMAYPTLPWQKYNTYHHIMARHPAIHATIEYYIERIAQGLKSNNNFDAYLSDYPFNVEHILSEIWGTKAISKHSEMLRKQAHSQRKTRAALRHDGRKARHKQIG
jgi:hypothetical protein